MMVRPPSARTTPAGVSATPRELRTSRSVSRARSSCLTWTETACWARCSRAAARVMFSSSATARNDLSCRTSISTTEVTVATGQTSSDLEVWLNGRVNELTVGQLAARSGVAVSALHFYEAKGLITSRRTAGNQRRFSRDTLRRIAFIRVSQRVGIPLKTIQEALSALPDGRTPTRDDWATL